MATWPFVGRDAELDAVVNAFVRAGPAGRVPSTAGSDASSTLLVGDAGVGKTRLARAIVARLEHAGWTSRWFTATETAQHFPLGCLGEVAADFTGDPVQSGAAFVDSVRAAGPRHLVVFDDVPYLDEVSAILVGRLGHVGTAHLLLTARTGEALPDPVQELWRGGFTRRVDVAPLDLEQTSDLVRAELGGDVEPVGLHRLWTVSGGNPLYIRLVVEGDLEAGRLVHADGVWWWPALLSSPAGGLSVALMDVLEQRVEQALATTSAQREVAELVALAEPIEVDVLSEVVDTLALEHLESAGLVATSRTNGIVECRMAHPLIGQLLRSRIGALRARRMNGELLDALRSRSSAADPVRLAALALASGRPPEPALLADAARGAADRLDLALAIKFGRAALAAGARNHAARFTLGYALSWSSRGDEAASLAETMLAEASEPGQIAEVAQLAGGNTYFVRGRPAEATAILERARQRVGTDDGATSAIDAMLSWFEAFAGHPRRALARGRRSLATGGSALSTACATIGVVTALSSLGREEDAGELSDRATRESVGSVTLGLARFAVVDARLTGAILGGDLRTIDAVLGLVPSYLEMGQTFLGAMARSMAGAAELARGRAKAAARLLGESAAFLRGVDRTGWADLTEVALTQARALTGDVAGAHRAAERADQERHPGFTFREPLRVLARAWLEAAEGSSSAGRDLAHSAAQRARQLGAPGYEAFALHVAVRLGDHSVAGRLGELAERTEGPRAALAHEHAAALGRRDGAALHAVSLAFEQVADLGAAVDAEAHASSAFRRAGLRGSAAISGARAEALAERCGLRTPAITTMQRGEALSRREYEVAALAARGLSNREIADRLVLSVRTVEGHLYRAGRKLGISDRTDLRRVFVTAPRGVE